MEKPMLSIVVAAYNSDLEKLKKTLLSAILQEGLSFEVIVTDDGSVDPHFDEIKDFFKVHNFSDYKLVSHEQNCGTVINVYDGLCQAEGKYTKLISAGDYLYSRTCLKEMMDYMEANGVKAAFSNAVYYSYDGELKVHVTGANPRLRKMYLPDGYDEKKCALNYLTVCDTALGAAFLTETEFLKAYIAKAQGKLILFEDLIYVLAIYEGQKIIYYPEITMWYETGVGISTVKNELYYERRNREFLGLRELVLQNTAKDSIRQGFQDFLRCYPYGNKLNMLLHKYAIDPRCLFLRIRAVFAKDKTPGIDEINKAFFDEINKEV